MEREESHRAETSLPASDPTTLTRLQIDQRITSLENLIGERIKGVVTRMEAMDKALILFHENITRVPTDTDKQIQHLQELHDEKFKSIQVQFRERDTRAEQTLKDSKVAVDAALQAAKEAVGEQNKSSALAIAKSEMATTKQIDQLGLLIQNTAGATNDKIDDIKSRLTLIEGKSFGTVATQLGHQSSASFMVALAVACVVVLGFIIDKLRP